MGRGYETFVAFIAHERSFSGMGPFMGLKCAILGESFRTVLASVGPLTSMFVHVCLKVSILRKGLRTQLALVGLDVVVNKPVAL